MSDAPEPCRCTGPNKECLRSGSPMKGRLWELCAGVRCTREDSEGLRRAWDANALDAPPPVVDAEAMIAELGRRGVTVIHQAADGTKTHVAGPPPPEPRPMAEWPLKARALALLRKPEDKGLGDTAARVLSRFGGERYKALYKRLTGKDCGCTDRQARLNAEFPY